ncbi:hypothetical protein AAC387_Pa06g2240 [Persea americana]
MSAHKEGGASPKKIESSSTLVGFQMQETSSLITPQRLDGTNYMEWSLNAQNKIRGRKCWGFISGTKALPKDVNSEDYEAWKDDNCLVKSLLLDTMTKEIRSLFLSIDYGKGDMGGCKTDIFDGVQGRVLATKPLHNIQMAYAMVCGEANRQVVMLGEKIGEGAAMISQKSSTSKKDRKCTHCGGTGHIVDTCFRLHGYPDWHPKGKKTNIIPRERKPHKHLPLQRKRRQIHEGI